VLLVARAVSVPLLLVGGIATGRALLPPRHAVGIAICSGAADMLANALYLFAVRDGLLSLTAVLVSLYPVPTVLLAGSLLRERLDRRRWLGVALALLAVALIAAP
jgi:drug/metabolite transporter (DMT)-like permease